MVKWRLGSGCEAAGLKRCCGLHCWFTPGQQAAAAALLRAREPKPELPPTTSCRCPRWTAPLCAGCGRLPWPTWQTHAWRALPAASAPAWRAGLACRWTCRCVEVGVRVVCFMLLSASWMWHRQDVAEAVDAELLPAPLAAPPCPRLHHMSAGPCLHSPAAGRGARAAAAAAQGGAAQSAPS